MDSSKSNSPLFLKCLVEELRIFGQYEGLTERIRDLLSADDATELYVKVLQRMETDYEDQSTQGAIERVMTSLWASRTGLAEVEILVRQFFPCPVLFSAQRPPPFSSASLTGGF